MRNSLNGFLALATILVVSPHLADAATLFALVNTGEIFISADQGTTWNILTTLPVRDAVSLSASTSSTELFLTTRSGVVYRSIDAGSNWTAMGNVTASNITDLGFRSDGDLILLTETGEVYRSTDEGTSFTALATLTGSNFVSLASRADGDLFALTKTGEVYTSTDLGLTWIPKGLITVSDALELRSVGTSLFVLTEASDVYTSANDGAAWTAVGTLNQVYGGGLTQDGTTLVAATKEGHIATSANGSTWTWVGSVNQLTLSALANDTPAVGGVPNRPPIANLVLAPPSPNPRPASGGAIQFAVTVPRAEVVRFRLFDASGRVVAGRSPEHLAAAGRHTISWDPGPLAAGHYFVLVESGGGGKGRAHIGVR